ncbi:hypothetical protein [Aeromonas hydrophila]|uniref:hypothetical protein n=1 Tax=Aeromonas hydrophila TaxID=644 RepID=UPI0007602EF1|nr:hypothetical protein [Aeromonas hydrophila]KWR67941.1 hypothetical protein ATO50_01825 [Aeromonas hydrophila]HAU4929028.1 hypothetical protein [Aeromonas hydrophila]
MVAAILGVSIGPLNLRTAEPAELVPVCTVLWVLKVPDLSLDIVLSLEIGAVVVASRCLLRRPSTTGRRRERAHGRGKSKNTQQKGPCEPVCQAWPDSVGHE